MKVTSRYYFDTLPIHPQPEPLESLVSYLIRLSEANAIVHIGSLTAMIGQRTNTSIREWSDFPRPLETLQNLTLCSSDILMQTTFAHLGRKFGRSTGPHVLQNFLGGSINIRTLRYCPMCLAERPYYPLTWRFISVQGCHIHAHRILEKCGYCGLTISGYATSSRIAYCPNCDGDLRTCSAQLLTLEEHRRAITQFEDLEFLLSPQPWEESYNILPTLIGQALALLRQKKGLTLKKTSLQTGISLANLRRLEHSNVKNKRGASLQFYSKYAAFLGVTLRNVFDLALQDELIDRYPATTKSEILLTKGELVERVRNAIEALHLSDKQLTRKNVLEHMGIRYTYKYYNNVYVQSPHIQELLIRVDDEICNERKKQQECEGKEMLTKVIQAIQKIQDTGKFLTFKAVAEFLGVSTYKFRYYPEIQEIIKNRARYQHHMTQRSLLREEEIVEKVRRAIQQLEEDQQRVTESAVCKIVGISRSCFTTYPHLREIIEKHADYRRRIQLEAIIRREDELLVQIEEAIQTLNSLNQRVTQEAIVAIVGMGQTSLRRYPRVKTLLKKEVGTYHHSTRTYYRVRENELVEKAKAAKEQLEVSGQIATQAAVARILGIDASYFKYYPNIKKVLSLENTSRSRTAQASFHEEELFVDIEKAIQELMEQAIAVTVPNVSKHVGISPVALRCLPRHVSLIKEVYKNQKRRGFQRREEQILQDVRETIKQLNELKLPITIAAIAKATHMSPAGMKHYPRVCLIFDQIVEGNLDAF